MHATMNKLNPKNTIKIREATKARSSTNQAVYVELPEPQIGAQELFYDTQADVCIYGGAAGGELCFWD